MLSADEARAMAAREDEARRTTEAKSAGQLHAQEAEEMRQAMDRVTEILAAIEQNIIERNRSGGGQRQVRIAFGMDPVSLAQCRAVTGVLTTAGYACTNRLHPGTGWYDDDHSCAVEDEQVLTVAW